MAKRARPRTNRTKATRHRRDDGAIIRRFTASAPSFRISQPRRPPTCPSPLRGATGWRESSAPASRPPSACSSIPWSASSGPRKRPVPARWRSKRPTGWTSSPARAKRAWPPPFDFGGKPCLLIMVDGEPRAFEPSARTCNARSSFAPSNKISSATATTASTTSTAATSPVRRRGRWKSTRTVKGERQTRTGGDHCLPKRLIRSREPAGQLWTAACWALLLRASGPGRRLRAGRQETRAHPPLQSLLFPGRHGPVSLRHPGHHRDPALRCITSLRPTRPSRACARS